MSYNNRERKLKKGIMRRVYVVFALRQIFSPMPRLFSKLALMSLFVWRAIDVISIKDVLINSPGVSNLGASVIFYTRAFVGTNFAVQIIFFGIIISALMIIRDAWIGERVKGQLI